MTKTRITVEVGQDENGTPDQVQLYLNKQGLELFIKELQALSEQNDHFHFLAKAWVGGDEALTVTPYDADSAVVGHLKVNYRPDHWDKEHFPHLFDETSVD